MVGQCADGRSPAWEVIKRLTLWMGIWLVVGACWGQDSATHDQRELGQKQSELISDQMHGEGTLGFFFLPPMVAKPGAYGDFVTDALPTVEIDEIDPIDAHLIKSITTFTLTTGPGDE